MKETFEFVKTKILKGMPAGMIVTRSVPDYSIGNWQLKTYNDNDNIRENLRSTWCSTLINVMFLDGGITESQVKKFLDEIDFKKRGRSIYLVYCLILETKDVNKNIVDILSNSDININRFSNIISHGKYSIFINDFIKYILYL